MTVAVRQLRQVRVGSQVPKTPPLSAPPVHSFTRQDVLNAIKYCRSQRRVRDREYFETLLERLGDARSIDRAEVSHHQIQVLDFIRARAIEE